MTLLRKELWIRPCVFCIMNGKIVFIRSRTITFETKVSIMSIKKLLTLFVTLCMIFILFAGCGQNSADPIEQSDESEEAFPPGSYAAEHKPPEIEDTGATADDIVNPYDHKDVDDLTDKEIDMIYILQNKSFDYYLDSMIVQIHFYSHLYHH